MEGLYLRSSLDCCSKEEIKRNKKKGIICKICNNTGYLTPKATNKSLGEEK